MIDWLPGIDPRAVVHPDAEIAEGVQVGPFSVIGPHVRIGPGCRIGPNVVIDGHVTIGRDNVFYPGCHVGFPPQDLKYGGGPTRVVIGDRNVFRENCQVHRGTEHGNGETRIGDDNYFMVASHVAHDCTVGNHVIFANNGTLAGHVEIGDWATVGAYSGVHQFCRVGRYAFIGGYSVVTRDALPYCLTVGDRARCYGINRIGLRRAGFSRETIAALDAAVRRIFLSGLSREEALDEVLRKWGGEHPEVREMVEFVRGTRRGVIPIRLDAPPA